MKRTVAAKRLGLLAGVLVAAGAAAASFSCTTGSGGAKSSPTPVATFPGSLDLDRTRELAVGGKLDAAADALSDAQRELEDAAPLRVRNLTLVKPDVQGYGLYTALGTDTVQIGEPFVLYFEPANFTHKFVDGYWHAELTADLTLVNAQGAVADEKPDFLVSKIVSHEPNREIQFVMRLLTNGLPEGDFTARVTLHDKLGNKEAIESVPVKFRLKK